MSNGEREVHKQASKGAREGVCEGESEEKHDGECTPSPACSSDAAGRLRRSAPLL